MSQADVVLTEAEAKLLSFHLACRLDDYEKEIRAEERKQGKFLLDARKTWSEAMRLKCLKLNPESLSGPLMLMDGTTIKPGDKL